MSNPIRLKFQNKQPLTLKSDYAQALEQLQKDGLRYLYIRAHRISPILDSSECLNIISSFCRHSRHCFTYVLLDSPRDLLSSDSQLLQLTRRLSGKILIKQFQDEPDENIGTWCCNDSNGVIYIPNDPIQKGFLTNEDPANHHNIKEKFILDWQQASDCSEIRQLSGL